MQTMILARQISEPPSWNHETCHPAAGNIYWDNNYIQNLMQSMDTLLSIFGLTQQQKLAQGVSLSKPSHNWLTLDLFNIHISMVHNESPQIQVSHFNTNSFKITNKPDTYINLHT